jgi:hypothetical protein
VKSHSCSKYSHARSRGRNTRESGLRNPLSSVARALHLSIPLFVHLSLEIRPWVLARPLVLRRNNLLMRSIEFHLLDHSGQPSSSAGHELDLVSFLQYGHFVHHVYPPSSFGLYRFFFDDGFSLLLELRNLDMPDHRRNAALPYLTRYMPGDLKEHLGVSA